MFDIILQMQVPGLLQLMSSSQDPLRLLCSGQLNITDFLIFPPANATSMNELVRSLQTAACQFVDKGMNTTALLTALTQELDLTMFVDQVRSLIDVILASVINN